MSTDAGLFDQFISDLETDAIFEKQRYLLLGFPHDTFASVTTNANALLRDIDFLFGDNAATPLAFVCHSRGGLLARTVAANLYDAGPARWKSQLAGCITFGTPHEGTPLAERPSGLLGIGVTSIRAGQPGGFMGASDVLALVAAYKGVIPGIDDLKPPRAIGRGEHKTTFVDELFQKERINAEQNACRLPILAIGGQGPHESHIEWVADRMFRGTPHDCVVELSSSAPERRVGVSHLGVRSDHFSYFSGRKGFEEAIRFLKRQLRYEDCLSSAPGTRGEGTN